MAIKCRILPDLENYAFYEITLGSSSWEFCPYLARSGDQDRWTVVHRIYAWSLPGKEAGLSKELSSWLFQVYMKTIDSS